jgi:hypothetical protein
MPLFRFFLPDNTTHATTEGTPMSTDSNQPNPAALHQHPDRVKLLSFLGTGPKTRTEIANDCFSKNKNTSEIDALLGPLIRSGVVDQATRESTGGRRPTVFTLRTSSGESTGDRRPTVFTLRTNSDATGFTPCPQCRVHHPRSRSAHPRTSPPVLWWALINEAEALAAATGWGLASVWGHIHRGDYDAARDELDKVKAAIAGVMAAATR